MVLQGKKERAFTAWHPQTKANNNPTARGEPAGGIFSTAAIQCQTSANKRKTEREKKIIRENQFCSPSRHGNSCTPISLYSIYLNIHVEIAESDAAMFDKAARLP